MKTIEVTNEVYEMLEDMKCDECPDFNSIIEAMDHLCKETLPRLQSRYNELERHCDQFCKCPSHGPSLVGGVF